MIYINLFSSDNSDPLIIYQHDILDFSFSSSFNIPHNKLLITLNLSPDLTSSFEKIELFSDDKLIFGGLIISKSISKSINGNLVKIFACSKPYILLNKIAPPEMYSNLSLKNLFDKYFFPLGFKFDPQKSDLFSTNIESFTILPKTTLWRTLQTFVDSSLNLSPFIVDDKYIMLSSKFPNSKLIISNDSYLLNNKYNFSSISLTKHNDLNLDLETKKSFISFTIPDLLPCEAGYKITVLDPMINQHFNSNEFIITNLNLEFKNFSFISRLILSSNP